MLYPKLAQCAQHMEADQGISVTEWSDDRIVLATPDGADLAKVEKFLATLSDADLETISIGEHEDMLAVANKSDDETVHEILDELFMNIGG